MVPIGTRLPNGAGTAAWTLAANYRARVDQYFTILSDTPFCRTNSDMLSRFDRYSFAIATASVTLR